MPEPTPFTRCTAQKRNGQFCDAPSMPDAPFPICSRHGALAYDFVRATIAEIDRDPAVASLMAGHYERQRLAAATMSSPTVADAGIVYYVQIGDYIKIGHSLNLARRLTSYPPNRRLLATETGTTSLERQRHREFATYRAMGNEWFRPGPALLDHINTLRRRTGAPLIRPGA